VVVHASGVHATVAGVLLGLAVPARELAPRFEHTWRPWSVGLAVPVSALFAAGVPVDGASGYLDALGSPIALAILAGLLVGKPLGAMAGAWLATRAFDAPARS
jgi:NhaA family Na+:H+ antiporter